MKGTPSDNGFPNLETEIAFIELSNERGFMEEMESVYRSGWLNTMRIKREGERYPLKKKKHIDWTFILFQLYIHFKEMVDGEIYQYKVVEYGYKPEQNIMGNDIPKAETSGRNINSNGFETLPHFNGKDLAKLNDNQIFDLIRKEKKNIEALADVAETKAAAKQIDNAKANIKALVEYVDSRHESNS